MNPVSKDFADTFADPAVIRGKDGWWYSYGTSDPLREGERVAHRIPHGHVADLVDWTYVGDAFTDADHAVLGGPERRRSGRPTSATSTAQYRMYYVVTETSHRAAPPSPTTTRSAWPPPRRRSARGRTRGAPGRRPASRRQVGDRTTSCGPSTRSSHRHRRQPVALLRLLLRRHLRHRSSTDDGTEAIGDPTMVAIDNKFEGSYVVRRGGYWYFFASTANCCAGPTTGYSVQVGPLARPARPLRRPRRRAAAPVARRRHADADTERQPWIGAGHNAVVTDLAGQDWIVYHALDRDDP